MKQMRQDENWQYSARVLRTGNSGSFGRILLPAQPQCTAIICIKVRLERWEALNRMYLVHSCFKTFQNKNKRDNKLWQAEIQH